MPTDGREASAIWTELDRRRRELKIQAVAARQFGVITLAQFIALGLTASAVRSRVATGYLHPLYRGVYAVGRPDVPVLGRRLAAVLACGRGALLSHLSAAAHHGLRQSAAVRFDVTIPRRSALRRSGIRIHRSTTLINEDEAVVDGVPCTSVARTLLDISSVLDDRGVERAVERAEILQVYDHRKVEAVLTRAAGQPGTRRLGRVIGIVRPGETVTESSLEEAMLALCRRCGFPEPIVNHEMLLGGERAKVDFFWPEQRVVVETDSFKYHKTQAAFRRDRQRDRLLELEGYGHARFADGEFDDDIAGIEQALEALIRP